MVYVVVPTGQKIMNSCCVSLNTSTGTINMSLSVLECGYSGVAACIKELEPTHYIFIAIATFSIFHCNIAVLLIIRNTLGTVNALYDFLQAPTKRQSKFEAAINTAKSPTTLKNLCETRWASRY